MAQIANEPVASVAPAERHAEAVEAFEDLLQPVLSRAYAAALGMTGSRPDAEDLVQEAALRACRAFGTFRPGTNFSAWFLRILTNVFRARLRKEQWMRGSVSVTEAPDALIKRLSDDVLSSLKSDKGIQNGDVGRVMVLVDSKIMPNVNFQRMTAATVGPAWRQATPEQQKRLQEEFKTLLVRTYAGALMQVADETVSVKPLRASPSPDGAARSCRSGSGPRVSTRQEMASIGTSGPLRPCART